MSDSKQPFELLRVIQYAFPMLFVGLAFAFYLNDRVPALMAWVFAAVGCIEYCLIGILRYKIAKVQADKYQAGTLSEA